MSLTAWQVSYIPEDDEIIIWFPTGLVVHGRIGYEFNPYKTQIYLGEL